MTEQDMADTLESKKKLLQSLLEELKKRDHTDADKIKKTDALVAEIAMQVKEDLEEQLPLILEERQRMPSSRGP